MESFLLRTRILAASRRLASRGFTLVEMMVVLSIIVVITTIALVGQGDFNRSVLLTDTSYTVALSLRQMQTLGLSSRKFDTVQNAGYGGYFTTSATGRGSYVLFADTSNAGSVQSNCIVGTPGTPEAKPGDCVYTAGADGIVQTYTFSRGFTVSDVCGMGAGGRICSSTGGLTGISVVFLRSSTESMIEGTNGGAPIPLTSAEIYITSGNGGTRAVCVSQVGQISVAYAQCPS